MITLHIKDICTPDNIRQALMFVEHVLTGGATMFMLYGFSRIAFSVGEHKEHTNNLPTIIFMMICKLFILGFILFNIYTHIAFYETTPNIMPINTGLLICVFDLLIILEVYFTNKHLAVVDRYLYSSLHKQFGKYWRRTYHPIIINKNLFSYRLRTFIQLIILVSVFLELFTNLDLHDGFFLILYVFYILTYLMIRGYFNNIGYTQKSKKNGVPRNV